MTSDLGLILSASLMIEGRMILELRELAGVIDSCEPLHHGFLEEQQVNHLSSPKFYYFRYEHSFL